MHDLIIVGGGPAGLTAAIYAARAGLSPLVVEKAFAGGQMTLTSDIVNYPGIEEIAGPELSARMEAHARALGASFVTAEVTGLDLTPGKLAVETANETLPSRALVLALGARRRKLGIPGEEAFAGRGVSYCAVCDGGFFRDRDAVVVGGGNTALEDALYLSGVCRHVTLVHRRDAFRGGKRLEEALRRAENVTLRLDCVPVEVKGGAAAETLLIRHVKTDEIDELPTSAVFIAVGVVPETELVRGKLPLGEGGRIMAGEDGRTPIPGVFVAGDARQKPLYQIVTACADGASAATSAAAFLQE